MRRKKGDRPAPILRLFTMQFVGLTDAQKEVPGFYWCAGSMDPSAPWGGAMLQVSKDHGDSWEELDTVGAQPYFGVCKNAPTVNYGFDATSSLDIEMSNGVLESVGERGAAEERWLGWLAGEVFAAQQCTHAGGKRYLVHGLRRGLHGSKWAQPYHGAGGEFVLLTGPGIRFVRVDLADLGRQMLVRAVPSYGAPELAQQHGLYVTGANVHLNRVSPETRRAVKAMRELVSE